MDEIKDVIAGLIQNYEVIRDSEVMMSKSQFYRQMPALRQCCGGQSQRDILFQQKLQVCPLEKQSLLCEYRQEHDFCHGAEIARFRQGKAQELQVRKDGQHLDATVFMEVSDGWQDEVQYGI